MLSSSAELPLSSFINFRGSYVVLRLVWPVWGYTFIIGIIILCTSYIKIIFLYGWIKIDFQKIFDEILKNRISCIKQDKEHNLYHI